MSLTSILIAIIVFGVVVLVHELGHFIAARRAGILVEEFAIGLGPKLFAKQIGETLYSIRALPLGGFCRMYGDDADSLASRGEEAKVEDSRSFIKKSIPQRMMVMFAGSFMNFVLSFLLFMFLVLLTGFSTTIIRSIEPDMPLQAAGMQAGDRIVSLDGSRIFLFEDVLMRLRTGSGGTIELGYVRDGQRRTVTVTPAQDAHGQYRLGFTPEFRYGLLHPVPEGHRRAHIGELATTSFMRIGLFINGSVQGITRMVTRQSGLEEVSGIIGIVGFIDDTYQAAVDEAEREEIGRGALILFLVLTMTQFGAILSTSLGIINLLPLPALDGGRLVFLAIEAVRRKPLPPEKEGVVHLAGFILLMALAVFIAYHDIVGLMS